MPPDAMQVRCLVLEDGNAKLVEDFLVRSLPWCYTTKTHLRRRVERTGREPSEILANRLPDPGSVMSGDFGEITTMFFLSSERKESTTLIKKWRYKENREKAAPLSDIVILYREAPERASKRDFVICAEAKQKATKSKEYVPIAQAVEGFEKDRTGRLARTIAWLREKAIDQEEPEMISLIERFALELDTEYAKYFKAVAVVDRALLDEELTREIDLPQQNSSFEVIVLGINDLKKLYGRVFQRAQAEVTIE